MSAAADARIVMRLQYHAQEKTLNLHQKKVESPHGRTLEQGSRKKVLL